MTGCTLQQYADAKRLPINDLKYYGLDDTIYSKKPAVAILYLDENDSLVATQFRTALTGKDKFRWKKGDVPYIYFNKELSTNAPYAVICEGASDCHTLWCNGINAFGVAGAGNWKEDYAELFNDYATIYVVIEPDAGGEAVLKWLKKSAIRDRVNLIRLDGFKDPSELYCDEPNKFSERWEQALDKSIPFDTLQSEQSTSFDSLIEKAKTLDKGDYKRAQKLLSGIGDLDDFQKEWLMKAIKKSSGFTLGTQRKSTKENNSIQEPDHLMLAQEVVVGFGKENLLSTIANVWCWKNIGVWQLLNDRAIKQLIQKVLEPQGHYITSSLINSIVDVLKTEIYAFEHGWDKDKDAINFVNGELYWVNEKWDLRPHCRESYRTTQIPHIYDPHAKCPRFEQFLQGVFQPDIDAKEKAILILELLGYTLVSNAKFETFVLLIGSGANGKSVLLSLIGIMVGIVNVAAVSPLQFNNRFQRAHLHLKLANIVTEIAEGGEISDAELKAIVSGELTTAEHKFQQPFDFQPFCTCWFGTNHLPHTRDFSDALFRRAKVIKFNRVFTYGKDADPQLKEKLAGEITGIINLALQHYAEVIKRGKFTEPASCLEVKNEWRMEADQVAQFVDERCELIPNAEIASGELYNTYKSWADEAGISRKLNHKNFTNRIIRLGGERHKGSGGKRLIRGISMKFVK